jgi:hypothetical protein
MRYPDNTGTDLTFYGNRMQRLGRDAGNERGSTVRGRAFKGRDHSDR